MASTSNTSTARVYHALTLVKVTHEVMRDVAGSPQPCTGYFETAFKILEEEIEDLIRRIAAGGSP